MAKLSGGQLSKAFVRLGLVSDEEITTLLSWHYGVSSVNRGLFGFDPARVTVIPAQTAREHL